VDPVLAALAGQHAELSSLIAPIGDDDWRRPTPCAGWDVADVVVHLAQSDELAIGSLEGRFDERLAALADGLGPAGSVDEGVDRMVARERGQPGAVVRERWETTTATLRRLLEGADPGTRVTWIAGELTVRTLATTRLAEAWIHSGDVAAALGVTLAPTDRLFHVARLAWRTLPYALGRDGRTLAGPVAFELRAPDGSSWDFVPDEPPATVVRGDAHELCLVAGRRVDARDTSLQAEGPDAEAVLRLVRTYA
jgi:uncharacterized protein (TIGR03084 family)